MEVFVVSLCLLATLRGTPASVVGTSTTETLDLSFFDNLASETSNPVHKITPETVAPPTVAKPTASPPFGVPSQGSRDRVPADPFLQSQPPLYPLPQSGQFTFVPSAPRFSYGSFVPPITAGVSSMHPSPVHISFPHLSLSSAVPLLPPSPRTSSTNRPSNLWPPFHSQLSKPKMMSSVDLSPFYAPVESLTSTASGSTPTGNFYSHAPLLPPAYSIPPAQVLSHVFPLSSADPSSHLDLSPPVSSSSINTYAPAGSHHSHPPVSSETLSSPSSGTSAPVVATFIRSYIPSNQFAHLPFLSPSQPSVSYPPYGSNPLPSHLSWNDIVSAMVNSYIPSSPVVSSISKNPAVPYVSAPSYSYPQFPYSSVPGANMVSGVRSYPQTPAKPSFSYISSASPAYSVKSHNSQPSFSTLGYMPSSSTKNLLQSYSNYPLQFNTI